MKKIAGINATPGRISQTFSSWGWSYHQVQIKQKLKYTPENVYRYFNHVLAMPEIVKCHGIERLKYLDEVHYVSKDLFKSQGVGPRNRRIIVSQWGDIKESYSMTLMTLLDRNIPFVASIRKGSNTQFDFGLFIASCIKDKYLVLGNILVLDNASVQVGTDSFSLIFSTLKQLDITLFLLPAYSPELNPAEYVFNFVKT